MKIKHLAAMLLLLSAANTIKAEEEAEFIHFDMEPKVTFGAQPSQPLTLSLSMPNTMDISASATTINTQSVKPLDEISWVGIPLFVAGIIAKGEKKSFRQDYNSRFTNTRLLTSFKTRIDDYTQFFGPAMTLGLKVGGVEGRSQWGRMLASAGMSYAFMAGFVNSIKYTAKELRPDGSTRNSWPSGHTATSFVGATILHKEYGLTRSPWYSVAGYGVATATGIMRVLNNRHWVSDVLSGAGIGIMSGELAYFVSDLIFKNKYLLRDYDTAMPNITEKPSFFSVSMGIGFGNHDLDFSGLQCENWEGISMDDLKLQFQSSTVMAVEGAYFLNKYVGLGGRLRVRSTPIKGWNQVLDYAEQDIQETITGFAGYDPTMFTVTGNVKDMIQTKEFSIESDHLTEFTIDAGLYFNIPLSKRFALGTKLLVGSSTTQALDLNAHISGTQWTLDYSYNVKNGEVDWTTLTLDGIYQSKDADGNVIPYDVEWDYFTLEGNRTTKFGTGISLTYAYKHNFSWRLFLDYDFTRKTYTLTKDDAHYARYLMPNITGLPGIGNEIFVPETYKLKKNMHQWVLGGSFCVNF